MIKEKSQKKAVEEQEREYTLEELQEAIKHVTHVYNNSSVPLEEYIGMLEVVKQAAIHEALKFHDSVSSLEKLKELFEDEFEVKEGEA